jgi:hypothetical protein
MTKTTIRTSLGLTLVGSHLLILAGILIAPYFSALTWNESVGFTEVVAPLFAGYTTAIVKYFINNAAVLANPGEPRVSMPYIVVSFLPTVLLVLLVAVIVIAHATNNSPATFEQSRTAIAGLEALFGVYVGFVLEDLFHYTAAKKAENNLAVPAPQPNAGN